MKLHVGKPFICYLCPVNRGKTGAHEVGGQKENNQVAPCEDNAMMVVSPEDRLRPSGSQIPESRLGTNHVSSASLLPSLLAPLTPSFPPLCTPGIFPHACCRHLKGILPLLLVTEFSEHQVKSPASGIKVLLCLEY